MNKYKKRIINLALIELRIIRRLQKICAKLRFWKLYGKLADKVDEIHAFVAEHQDNSEAGS